METQIFSIVQRLDIGRCLSKSSATVLAFSGASVAVLREDWIKDTTWQESHLTRSGWKSGTMRTEKGRYENERDRPDDALLTVRALNKIPFDEKERCKEWSEVRWRSKDAQGIEEAQKKWGCLPKAFPQLSKESAVEHKTLRAISHMQMPPNMRPRGSLVPRERWER